MHSTFVRIALVLAGLVAWTGAGQAATSAGTARFSIVKAMRAGGFTAKTASWTAQSLTTDDTGKTVHSESQAWISGERYRLESKNQKNQKVQIILDDGTDMYLYNPEKKQAMKWGPSMESMYGSVLNGDLFAESARQRKSSKKIGSETLDGKPCAIYAYQSTLTMMGSTVTSDVKEWVWTKENFPMKSIVKTPKHQMKIAFMTADAPASETTTVIKDLQLNGSMDNSLFTLPAGTKVETLEMPPQARGGSGTGSGATDQGQSQAAPAAPASGEGNQGETGSDNQQGPPPAVKNMLKGLF